jgi:hypothetical protein
MDSLSKESESIPIKKYSENRDQASGSLVLWYQGSHLRTGFLGELEHLKTKTKLNRRDVYECDG